MMDLTENELTVIRFLEDELNLNEFIEENMEDTEAIYKKIRELNQELAGTLEISVNEATELYNRYTTVMEFIALGMLASSDN